MRERKRQKERQRYLRQSLSPTGEAAVIMPALRCRKVKAHRRSTSSFHPHPQPVLPLEHANPPEHPYHAGLRKEVEENGGEERRGWERRRGERRGEIWEEGDVEGL